MGPPWFVLLLISSAAAVQCPDGSMCGEKSLCCELPGEREYGCCPKGEVVSPSLPMVHSQTTCSDPKSCPDEYSCLSTPQGGFACCPLPQGTSCQDGRHCCAAGSQCSEDGHYCIPASNQSAIICPDGRSECPNDATCCMMPDQSWGCCPMPQATCCNDHLHCCPHNTLCDIQHGRCVSNEGYLPWSSKVPALKKVVSLGNIVQKIPCPDGSSCPDGTTCCQQTDFSYGCCPFISAVCCSDKIHCCPSGTVCDLAHAKCVSPILETPLFQKIPALMEKVSIVQCDGTVYCPDLNTCCRLPSGEWGCCPLEKAVCCEDHIHCCPSGATCVQDQCVLGEISIPWFRKTPALSSKVTDVKCDDTHSCEGDSTCCRLASGDWGCCPMVKAVCCDDHIHCCPNGYTCSQGDCTLGDISIPWLNKTPALRSEATDVKCDETHSCKGDSTCCRLASGEWGCCPMVEAVCCDDHIHCCPNGYTCSHGECKQGGISIPWLNKTPALRSEATDVKCDETHSCKGDSTCCRLASGEWGCCPMVEAVCCDDHIHCCPKGFTCSEGQCAMGEISIPWLKKTPALRSEATDVQCDSTHSCRGRSTCCRLASGQWGCCPFEKAVCCDDHIHCCPHGFTCSQGQCKLGEISLPWFRKTVALRNEVNDVKCDDSHSCVGDSTCCRLASGEWGCCPLPKAVCCDDHIHCCPNGYTCSHGQCEQKEIAIPWLSKTPALRNEATRVKCDDSFSCEEKSTCCRLLSGAWGCCPIEQAVCCPDHWHCCPSGFSCDSRGSCVRNQLSIPWLRKALALPTDVVLPTAQANDVICDESYSCSQGKTCCPKEDGGWACCPLEEGVCCSDHLHCCPSGYTCDVASGTCKKPLDYAEPSLPVSRIEPLDYVWCDPSYACYDGQTCCRGLGGTWSCCPYTQGVCCPDLVHCCPYGYVCLNHGASCGRSGNLRWDMHTEWQDKTPLL
ncbi:progranulin [Rhinophrynus dorsalis]